MGGDAESVIWDRAVRGGGNAPRAGDLALAAVLRFSGIVNHGGVGHALDVLDGSAFRSAAEGFRYLGEGDVADLVLAAWREYEPQSDRDDTGTQRAELEQRFELGYYRVDQQLSELFAAKLRSSPEDFAPFPEPPAPPG